MSTTTVTRLTPLMRNQLRANLQMTPLRPFHRSLSCQGHATSRFASTSASNFTSSAAARSLPLPTRAKGDWSKLIMRSVKQTLVYFPFYATFLGWPLAAKAMIEWSRGV